MSKSVKPGSYSEGRKFEDDYINFSNFFKDTKYKYVPDPDKKDYGKLYLGKELIGETYEQSKFYDIFIRGVLYYQMLH